MKRCFIAIRIPADKSLQKIYQLLQKNFKSSAINWVKYENLHLTVIFLGEINDSQIKETILILNKTCNQHNSFNCELKGFGTFGRASHPAVLWIGIHSDEELFEIHKHLSAGLTSSGLKKEDKPYRPHLTLGRVKVFRDNKELQVIRTQYGERSFHKFLVESLVLYESNLTPSGPVYSVIEEFPLNRQITFPLP